MSCSAQFMDEMQQFEGECLGEDKFPCMGGGCILQSQYCDGIVNCEDGTDESFCGKQFENSLIMIVNLVNIFFYLSPVDHQPDVKFCNKTDHFMCLDHKKCIPNQWICNHETDCDDGSDEVNCTASVVTANVSFLPRYLRIN